jgi:hypothetical protein
MKCDPAQMLLESYRLEQLGSFSAALEGYTRALEAAPDLLIAAVRYFRLRRDLRRDTPSELRIVWQIDPRAHWEADWVRYLLSGLNAAEIVDGQHASFHDGSIVIDNRIGPKKTGYYFELLKRGCRFGLFHLSDERFYDDCGAYDFANFVLRNYWSRASTSDKRVLAVPLGMMNGFRIETQKAASERRHVWAFAGNAQKSTRRAMRAAMSTIEGGFFHATYGTDTPTVGASAASDLKTPLEITEYARLMSDAIFAPCPAGWENLDSFRVCEAFEAGCIPIVEARPSYDYFQLLMPGNPALKVESWSDAPRLIQPLLADNEALNEKQMTCARWWQAYKPSLVQRVRRHALSGLAPLRGGKWTLS